MRSDISEDLLRAAVMGDVELARAALEAAAPIDAVDATGRTPLVLAIAGGHVPVVELLLDAGADPDSRCPSGTTARRTAGWGPCRGLLLGRWCTPSHGAESTEAVERLVAGIWFEDVALVKAMLAFGVDPDATDPNGGRSMLDLAIEADHTAALEALIAAGASINRPDAFGALPLILAIDAELDFNRQGATPLDLRLVAPLLRAGADPDAMDDDGDSARTFASKNGYLAALDLMASTR